MSTFDSAYVAGGNRPFTREDLLKKENRINVELFGAHSIPEFWEPLCDLLGISKSAWLTREVVAGTGNRPDFIVNGTLRKGCIEIELAEPNQQQLGCYGEDYEPVICIVGRRNSVREHPSLEEVALLARSIAEKLQGTNRPAIAVLNHLAATIDDGLNGFRGHASVQPIPVHMLDLPWFTTAIEPLRRLERARYLTNRTTSSASLSLQLERLPCMNGRHLALLTWRDPAFVHVPEPEEMVRVFNGALAEVTGAWHDLLKLCRPHWRVHLDRNKRIRIEIKDFEQNAEAFAGVFTLLAERIL